MLKICYFVIFVLGVPEIVEKVAYINCITSHPIMFSMSHRYHLNFGKVAQQVLFGKSRNILAISRTHTHTHTDQPVTCWKGIPERGADVSFSTRGNPQEVQASTYRTFSSPPPTLALWCRFAPRPVSISYLAKYQTGTQATNLPHSQTLGETFTHTDEAYVSGIVGTICLGAICTEENRWWLSRASTEGEQSGELFFL